MVRPTKGRGGEGPGGGRKLAVRLRPAEGRKIASTRWLQRQLNDPYVEEAKRQGYRSRAAFKLAEIDDKHRLLKPGIVVIDLGAATGGWSQIAGAAASGAAEGRGKLLPADLSEIEPVPGVGFMVLDVTDAGAGEKVRAALD